ncbi:hypothetical protein Tco_0173790 [Tanacetum coccineum]
MKAKFLPENHRQEAFLDYHNLSQRNMTVEEVINEFDKLRMSGIGHYARDYSNLKKLAFVPDDACLIYDTIAEPELVEPGDKLVYPDRREALFSIGKNYKDEVWCEVIPMDAAHILLGHPWQFDRKTKHDSPYVFTLVVVEENKIISEPPLQVQPLLREFADVIPDNIPPGLPAMRDIQHCIDFISGFVWKKYYYQGDTNLDAMSTRDE